MIPLSRPACLRAACAAKCPNISLRPPLKARHARDRLLRRQYRNQGRPPPPAPDCQSLRSTGQRVQKSVFECQVNLMQFETLERELLAEIELKEDNLRLYRLPDSRGAEVREHGTFRSTDFNGPLVL
jgi:CRISPR-associated protein Cas2